MSSYLKSFRPNQIVVGETFVLELLAKPNASVSVVFTGPSKHSFQATSKGGETFYLTTQTSDWLSGSYIWEAWEEIDEIKRVIERQTLTILPALEDLPIGDDVRSLARKAIENIEATLSGKASIEARRYKINNRELERYSIAELLQLLSFWKQRLAVEEKNGSYSLGPRIEVRI